MLYAGNNIKIPSTYAVKPHDCCTQQQHLMQSRNQSHFNLPVSVTTAAVCCDMSPAVKQR